MNEIAERLTELVERKFPGHGGVTLAAAKCGVSLPQLSGWMRGHRVPTPDNFVKLADGLGVTVAYLAFGIESRYQIERRGSVAAGPFAHIDTESKFIETVDRFPKGHFALAVSGKSCTRFGICDGDLVIVKPTVEPVENRFLVVQSPEGYTLKGFRDGRLWRWPESGELEPIPDPDWAVIVGVVVKVIGERLFPSKSSPPASKNGKHRP